MFQNHVQMTHKISCASLIEFRFVYLKWLNVMYEIYQNRSRNVEMHLLKFRLGAI
jgi:hypothetical protein